MNLPTIGSVQQRTDIERLGVKLFRDLLLQKYYIGQDRPTECPA
jgi:hypothetical protein